MNLLLLNKDLASVSGTIRFCIFSFTKASLFLTREWNIFQGNEKGKKSYLF